MGPFVLSRNAFHLYCSEYLHQPRENLLRTINQRYEHFLQTLDRLQAMTNRNVNSTDKDTLTVPSPRYKKTKKKHFHQRMPKVLITVSCAEHLTKQRPNIQLNSII